MAALIKCRTCGTRVSSNAKMCPRCGERSPEPYKDRIKYSLIGFITLAIFASLALSLFFLIYWFLW